MRSIDIEPGTNVTFCAIVYPQERKTVTSLSSREHKIHFLGTCERSELAYFLWSVIAVFVYHLLILF